MQGGDEKGKCGFEVDAVGRQNDIWFGGDMTGDRLPPIQNRCYHGRTEFVEGDIVLHEFKHGYLVCDVDGHVNFTATSNRQSDETTSSSQFHATRCISSQIPRWV